MDKAKKMTSYLIRNIPVELWRLFRSRIILDNDMNIRCFFMNCIEEYVKGFESPINLFEDQEEEIQEKEDQVISGNTSLSELSDSTEKIKPVFNADTKPGRKRRE